MSPVIRISDSTYDGLQSLAEPFKDTPDSTIARLLAFYKQYKSTESASPNNSQEVEVPQQSTAVLHPTRIETQTSGIEERTSQLLSLSTAAQRDLHDRKPVGLEIEGKMIPVRNWAELCERFVRWLVDKGYLTSRRLPILNHSGRDRYFVNTEPEHFDPKKKATWHEVAGFHVDTKYTTSAHVKNLLAALKQLELEDLSVKIEFPSDC